MKQISRYLFMCILILSILLYVVCKGKKEPLPEKEQAATQSYSHLLKPDEAELSAQSPETFQVKFETTKGDFIIEVHRSWSPHGADRLYYLAKNKFYDNVRFFRVIKGFMAQFGYHGDPEVIAAWTPLTIADDPVTQSNLRGYVTFAKSAMPNSRTTQLFINYGNNSNLDKMGFSPVGKVIEGMDVVDNLYGGYGEGAPRGRGPGQGRIRNEGNKYLNENFPKLDYIKKARLVDSE